MQTPINRKEQAYEALTHTDLVSGSSEPVAAESLLSALRDVPGFLLRFDGQQIRRFEFPGSTRGGRGRGCAERFRGPLRRD